MPLDEFHTTHYFSVNVINREYFFLLSIAIFDIIRLIMFLSFIPYRSIKTSFQEIFSKSPTTREVIEQLRTSLEKISSDF